MARPVVTVFLSAVTAELGSYRAEVARALREKGCHVRVQEDFNTGPGTLLQKLDAQIQQCDAVVCLIGERFGAEPAAEEGGHGAERHSYTQWEYLIARRRNKPVFVFYPDPAHRPSDPEHRAEPESVERQLLQRNFFQTHIRERGVDRTRFRSHDDLVRKVLVCDLSGSADSCEGETPASLDTSCPYVGLRRFEERDRAYFYGRTAKIADLLDRMDEAPLLLVTGNSGSGKSSLIRAGVIPRWRIETESDGREAIAVVCTPNDQPFEGLWAGLLAAGIDASEIDFVREPSPAVLARLGETLRREHPEAGLLFFIDQFEEVFTRIPQRDRELREIFIAALVEAAKQGGEDPSFRVVLALRDDFFGALREYESLFRITDRQLERIVSVRGEELREIIEEPARSHGVRLESGLVDRIVRAVEGRDGMLPLLQYTLEALWREERRSRRAVREAPLERGGLEDRLLTTRSYFRIGGVEGALNRRVSRYYRSKTERGRRAVRNILLSLVEIDETTADSPPVSRSASRETLVAAGSEEVLEELLTRERLLVTGRGEDQEARVELAHEALIGEWEEFGRWIRESREAIRQRNALIDGAKMWNAVRRVSGGRGRASDELWRGSKLERALELNAVADGARQSEFDKIGGLGDLEREFLEVSRREKRQQVRRLRIAAGFASLIACLAIASTYLAFHLKGIADGRLRTVEKQQFASEEQKRELERKKLEAERQRAVAIRQKEEAQWQAGKGWLLRSDVARGRGRDVDALFYAARALGFRDLGKPPGADPELFPALLTANGVRRERALAMNRVELSAARPFLWSSPIASHHSAPILALALSPDGGILASGAADHRIRLWDVDSGREIAVLNGHTAAVHSLSFAPAGDLLASGSSDGTVRLWDVSREALWKTIAALTESVWTVEFHPSGKMVAANTGEKAVGLWNIFTGELVGKPLEVRAGPVWSATFSPDGSRLATASLDGAVRLWTVDGGGPPIRLADHSGPVRCVAFSPDGATLAGGGEDGTVRLWPQENSGEPVILRGHDGAVRRLAFSRDGAWIASGGEDRMVRIWNAATGRLEATHPGHGGWVNDLVFDAGGAMIISASEDKTIRFRERSSGRRRGNLAGHADYVRCAVFDPDGEHLATASDDDSVRLWDLRTGRESQRITGHTDDVWEVVFHPGGDLLASASSDQTVRWWNLRTGENEATLRGHGDIVRSLAVSPDGRLLASGSDDKTIRLWAEGSNREHSIFRGHGAWINGLAFHPNGRILASGSADQTIRLWDVVGREELAAWEGHEDAVTAVAFHPGGMMLASGSWDGTVRLWEVISGKELASFSGHQDYVLDVAFSPDGRSLASGSMDGEIRVWEIALDGASINLTGHASSVSGIAFSPDGELLASASYDHTAKLWEMGRGREQLTVEGGGGPLRAVVFAPEGEDFLTGAADGAVRIWSARTGREKATWTGEAEASAIEAVATDPAGRFRAWASDEAVTLWDAAAGRVLRHLPGERAPGFHPGGKLLATCCGEGGIRLRRIPEGDEVRHLSRGDETAEVVAFGPGGEWLVSLSPGGTLRRWEVATGRELGCLVGHTGMIECLAVHPAEGWIACGTEEGPIWLWEPSGQSPPSVLEGHEGGVRALEFAPFDAVLASAGEDDTVRLWDAAGGIGKAVLRGHTDDVLAVDFRPDGAAMVSVSWDGTARLWTVGDSPDLFSYLEEKWCRFDEESGELRWHEPVRHLYAPGAISFRNLPAHSFLHILQSSDSNNPEERSHLDLLRYLKTLRVENWAAAERHHGRLNAEQASAHHGTVSVALGVLEKEIVAALERGDVFQAREGTRRALLFTSRLRSSTRKALFARLGRRIVDVGISRDRADGVLSAFPNDASRHLLVSASIGAIHRGLAEANDFGEALDVWRVGRSWLADAVSAFADSDRRRLFEVMQGAASSTDPAAGEIWNAAREELRRRTEAARRDASPEARDALSKSLVGLAWVLATSPGTRPELRGESLAVAEAAHELAGRPGYELFETMAAACAATGRFAEAENWQLAALEMAPAEERPALESRLDSYRRGRPHEAEDR